MARNLVILTYHRVLDAPDPLHPGEICRGVFESHMRTLSRYFRVLPLLEACRQLVDGSLPSRAVSITFDDGYADNYHNGWPILQRFGLPATLFVATGYLDGGRMWNDTVIESLRRIRGSEIDLRNLDLGRHVVNDDAQREAVIRHVVEQLKYLNAREREARSAALNEMADSPVPDNLMLDIPQVKELSQAGVEIGAHTVSHPILRSTDVAEARDEITRGKKQLEEIVGREVRSFAYPNGRPGIDYDPVHVEIVKEAGFECAVSTTPGAARRTSDILQLPRFGPWAESSLRFGVRVLKTSF